MHKLAKLLAVLTTALVLHKFASAQDGPNIPPPRVGPVTLPTTLRSPFASEVEQSAAGAKTASASLLPGLPLDTSFACLKWTPQGPGPATNGDLNISPHPYSGCVSAIAPHPTNADILYIGTVNGGVWRSDNATSTNITWTPLTDDQLSLSIGALALDPTDASGQTLVAAIGRRSSFNRAGGALIGLLRTTDGGASWTRLGATALAGRSFYSVAARGNLILAGVEFTDNGTATGLYRTTDGGVNFTNMSGFGTGLPPGAITHLAADPGNAARFYAHVGSVGVYRTDNSGANWVNVTAGIVPLAGGSVTLCVFNGNGTNAVYAAQLTGGLSPVYRSTNLGTNWVQMDSVIANAGGSFNGFTADPANPNLVYLSGLYTRTNFPYSGRVVRGDASLASGTQWTSIASTNGTGNGTAPHTDSRALAFTAAAMLVEGDDGGIYGLPVANTGNNGLTSQWRSLNGNLQNSEMHSMAYDRVAKILIGGAQDTGAQEQVRSGQPLWNKTSNGDGGDAAVDVISIPGQSIRYESSQNLGGFYRATYNASNVRLNIAFPAQTPLGTSVAMNPQFVNPIALNAVAPARLLFGAKNGVYESFTQGNTVTNIGAAQVNSPSKMAYGGRIGAVTNAEVIYVGSGNSVLVRTNAGAAPTATAAAFPGGNVQSIVLDPSDWRIAYVVGTTQALVTATAGASWTDLTGNLVGAGTFHSVEFLTLPGGDAIVVGADLGAYIMRTAAQGVWKTLGNNLPNAPVFDTHYDPIGNVLAISTFGRGAWLYDFNPALTNVVTTLADGGTGSLRDAINLANAAGCPNYLSFTANGTLSLTSSLPAMLTSTFITGPGTNNLTIDGGGLYALINFGGTTNSIGGVRLVNGFSSNSGAGILNAGRTVVQNCIVSNSATVGAFGGAVANLGVGASLFVTNCVFVHNTVRGGNGESRPEGSTYGGGGGGGAGTGGAVYSDGPQLTLQSCAFIGNAAMGGNGGNGGGNAGDSRGGNGGFPNPGTGGAVNLAGGTGGLGGGGGGGGGTFTGTTDDGGAGGFGGGGGGAGARSIGNSGGNGGTGGQHGGAGGTSCCSFAGGGGGGAGLGGALFVRTGAVAIVNCTFSSNVATNGSGGTGSFGLGNGQPGQGVGGAIFNAQAKLTVANLTFSGNGAATADADVSASTVVTTLVDSGPGSLRQAVCNAGARPGPDTITFATNGPLALTSGEIAINDDLTITGPGAAALSVSGNGTSRIFRINNGAVAISDLTLRDGHDAGDGGAIFVISGQLALDRITFTNNSAGANGGALGLNSGSTLTLRRCLLAGNSADTINGGAIHGGGSLLITESTFYTNRAGLRGGAIHHDTGVLTMSNCTVSGNVANDHGGGISVQGAALNLQHVTIFNNIANNDNLGVQNGGGIHNDDGGSVSLSHTIIAGNITRNGSGPDAFGSFISGGFNLIGVTNGSAGWNTNDLTGVSPLLGALRNNDGPTPTHYPLPGSPIIDAGDPAFSGAGLTDQRGQPRVWSGRVDIGAVEFVPAGYALNLDGVNDFLILSNAGLTLPTNDVTVEFWERVETVRDQFTFVLFPDQPSNRLSFSPVRSNSTTYWDFGDLFNGGRVAYATPSDTINSWTHWALVSTHAGNTMQIYRNGVLDASTATNRSFVQYAASLVLGARLDAPQEFFKGDIDEFRIWSVARTPAEIQANMFTGLCMPQTNLWLYWKFDEPSGATVLDHSGNGHDALLFNGATRVLSFAPLSAPGALTILRQSPTQVRVIWSPNVGCLQSATNVSGPWSEISATNGQVITTTPMQQFFRLTQ